MSRRTPLAGAALGVALALAGIPAQAKTGAGAKAPAAAKDPRIPFEKYRLANGLEVMLHRDTSVPLVAVNIWYHVGSGDETPGKSGFAHLFEHMMFQGAEHIGEDAHFDLLQKIGGTGVNGTTNPDRTNYYEVVPSNQLEAALWLESDRMGYMLPLLGEKSLANQRDVVRNERRQRYDNVPYGKDRFAVADLLYAEGHPYRYLTIGRHEDLEAASVEDVRAFFQKWYVPSNATLVLAGDFETAAAKKLVEKWFGSFPKTEKPVRKFADPTPVDGSRDSGAAEGGTGSGSAASGGRSRDLPQGKTRTIQDDFAKLRRIHWAWHSPGFYKPGDAEMDLLANALSAEGTGRLYKRLILEKQLVRSVNAYQGSAGASSSFNVVADLLPETDMDEVTKILEEELRRVLEEPISDRELRRTVAGIESQNVFALEQLMNRAETLQAYNHYVGDPDWITQDLDRYRKSTPARIRDVAAQYLTRSKRVEVVTMPAAQGGK